MKINVDELHQSLGCHFFDFGPNEELVGLADEDVVLVAHELLSPDKDIDGLDRVLMHQDFQHIDSIDGISLCQIIFKHNLKLFSSIEYLQFFLIWIFHLNECID